MSIFDLLSCILFIYLLLINAKKEGAVSSKENLVLFSFQYITIMIRTHLFALCVLKLTLVQFDKLNSIEMNIAFSDKNSKTVRYLVFSFLLNLAIYSMKQLQRLVSYD